VAREGHEPPTSDAACAHRRITTAARRIEATQLALTGALLLLLAEATQHAHIGALILLLAEATQHAPTGALILLLAE
jgi:hypothetical protein